MVPFAGSAAAASAMLDALGALEMGPLDELIVVDNGADPVVPLDAGARVIRAAAQASSYYARNSGARQAQGEWLLFVDSDCIPDPGLLNAYFEKPAPRACALLAGSVLPAASGGSLVAEYAASRGQVTAGVHLGSGPYPAGITANLMVRRDVFEEAGGFEEGIRSGGDLDLCWRVQEAGWELEPRPGAIVRHSHSTALGEALGRAVRYGGGCRWIEERRPGASEMLPLGRSLVRSAGGALVWALRLQPRRALFKLIDGLWALAMGWGYYVKGNAAEIRPPD